MIEVRSRACLKGRQPLRLPTQTIFWWNLKNSVNWIGDHWGGHSNIESLKHWVSKRIWHFRRSSSIKSSVVLIIKRLSKWRYWRQSRVLLLLTRLISYTIVPNWTNSHLANGASSRVRVRLPNEHSTNSVHPALPTGRFCSLHPSPSESELIIVNLVSDSLLYSNQVPMRASRA